jgi:predicted O-methyltransferase YrrM
MMTRLRGIAAISAVLVTATSARAAPPLPADLEQLLGELEKTQARYHNVPRKDGEFLHLLVKAAGAKRVLEIGTANGYSGIWIARALAETGGALTTIEIDPDKVKEARRNFKRAGVEGRVTTLEGDAHKVARTVAGPFDVVFIDAEKGGELDYFNATFSKLQPGGLLVVHNAIRFADSMRDFIDTIRKHPQMDAVTLSLTMEDGFLLAYKRRSR